ARQSYEKSLMISARLAEQYPDSDDYARSLAGSYSNMGDLSRALGDEGQTRRFYEQALAVSERLAEQAPGNADYARDLWVTFTRMAEIAEDEQIFDDAQRWWQKAYDALYFMQESGMFVSVEDQEYLKFIASKSAQP